MSVAKEFEKANQKYASSFTKGDLALPPARSVTVLVCMDARIDPAAALGLQEGDAHVPHPQSIDPRLSAMQVAVQRTRSDRLSLANNSSVPRRLS